MSDVTGDGFLDMVVGTYVHPLAIIFEPELHDPRSYALEHGS